MRLPQLQRPALAAVLYGGYRPILPSFTLPIRPSVRPTTPAPSADTSGVVDGRRYASVKSQGAYRIPNKKTLAKKLGAKRSGDQYVIPGNIIFKQRGTIWHAGENALRGRDHTIHAAATGYVKYYRDPELHPTRQYIGVAFNKEDVLPYPRLEPRRRKLGMVAHTRKPGPSGPRPDITPSGLPRQVVREGGLVNLEKLEAARWSRDKKRELAETNRANMERNAASRVKHAERVLRIASRKAAAALAKAAREESSSVAAPTAATASAETAAPVTAAPVTAAVEIAAVETAAPATAAPVTAAPATAAPATAAPATAAAEGSVVQTKPVPKRSSTEVAAAQAAVSEARAALEKAVTSAAKKTGAVSVADSAKTAAKTETKRRRKRKLVMPLAYLQKRWLERRKTKVLVLNPRSYAFAETNAAIGRLASRTMYRAPWELGGRKARFRSRRHKREQKILKAKENREFLALEKERERIAAEKARQKKLEKQRVRGAGKGAASNKAEKAEGGEVKEGEAKEVAKPVEGSQAEKVEGGEVKKAETKAAVEPAEAKKPVEGNQVEKVEARKPVEGSQAEKDEGAKLKQGEPKAADEPIEAKTPVEAKQPVEGSSSEKAQAQEDKGAEKPVDA